jgi:beta-glucosidase
VVQLYLRDQLASVARPVTELKGFGRIHLAVGEEREVEFVLSSAELEMLNGGMQWVVEPGGFSIAIGASSRDIRLRGTLEVR